jgi:hypothetical protein
MIFLKQLLTGIVLLLLLSACNKVTIVVDKLPNQTSPKDNIYLTGNFNYWDPADSRYQLKPLKNGKLAVTLPIGWGRLEYKFTRGDFTTEEVSSCGYELKPHILSLRNIDTIKVQIESWKDMGLRNCESVMIKVKAVKPLKTGENIYISGNFNKWNASEYDLKPYKDGSYGISLKKLIPTLEYKFTRGAWNKEEVNEYGGVIENRVFSFGTDDTIDCVIPFWKDQIRIGGNKINFKIKIPENTPERQQLYVAGNFNGWNANNPNHKLEKTKDGYFIGSIDLVDFKGIYPTEFKFTRGTWSSVECEINGRNRPNRSVLVGVLDTLNLEVKAWRDFVKE